MRDSHRPIIRDLRVVLLSGMRQQGIAAMDLKELETFVAVAEHLHFGIAAQYLGVAQPQVSRRISQLERELAASLFERNNRAVKLTAFGKAFLPEAIALVKKAEETRQRALELSRSRDGLLTVGMIDAAALNAAPPVFREFHRRHPGVHIAFRHSGVTSAAQMLALAEGSADMVFTHPPDRVPDAVDHIRLVNDPLVAVLALDHPLASADHLDLAQLRDEPWIMFPRADDPPIHDRIMGLCRTSGFTPQVGFETTRMMTRLGLIASGYGVHLVHSAWRLLPFPGVAYIPVTPSFDISVACFWRRDNESELLRALVEVARDFEV